MSDSSHINWKTIVRKWQHSDLSKAEFCRQNNIKADLFYYHSVQLKAFSESHVHKIDLSKKTEDIPFVEVICKDQPPVSPRPIILRLDCGGSIELSPGFDREILKRIFQVAKSL